MRPTAAELAIELQELGHRFPEGYQTLQSINLRIPPRAFVTVVGPSGSGKSTLLNLMAGLMSPTEGTVQVFGQTLQGINASAAYLFQQDGLLPWATARDNISLALRLRNRPEDEAVAEAESWLQRVGLTGFANHYPAQLSGGMRKRVALAQALIAEPKILLMDEPFSALDLHLRLRMEEMLLHLWNQLRTTIVFVTHDLDEAIALSDRVIVLSAGPNSRIVGDFEVNLARPRPLLDIRAEPGFASLYSRIWATLRGEVIDSLARQS